MSDTNETAAQDPQGGEPNGAPEATEGKTYTQADLDRILQGRLAKFSDYDQMKQQLEELRTANQTDTEKAIEEAKKAGAAEAAAEVSQRLLQSEARAIAAELGFHDPKDAHLHVPADIVSDGEVDLTRLQEAIEKVAADKPYLVRGARTPSAQDVGIGRATNAGETTSINTLLRAAAGS